LLIYIWGASFVSWEFVGGLLTFLGSCGFLVVLGFLFLFLGVCWGLTYFFWVFGAFLCFRVFLCFCGLAGLFLCILLVYLGLFTIFLIKSYLSKYIYIYFFFVFFFVHILHRKLVCSRCLCIFIYTCLSLFAFIGKMRKVLGGNSVSCFTCLME
jgi:hypothetical protein